MKYIDSWLSGLGLDYLLPKLKANGITTPKKLASVTLRDMFEFGVDDPEDRKKLYFLIQRLQTILSNRVAEEGEKGPEADEPNSSRLAEVTIAIDTHTHGKIPSLRFYLLLAYNLSIYLFVCVR